MRSALVLVLASLLAAPAAAAPPEAKGTIDLRVRWEGFDTPSGDAARDERYDFTSARLRLGGDLKWKRVTLHGMLQGARTVGLPENAAFGPGASYFGANGGETDPSAVGVAELNAAIRSDDWQLVLGRQPYSDGVETMTGVEYLDGIKRRRMGDRLVGIWDWPNVGRRYDGVSFGGALGGTHLAGYALRPLAGGINYQDAFEPLDDLTVYGLTVTGKYGEWLPRSDVRLFALQYDDGRPGAVATAGDDLGLTTVGASLLAGNERNDVLVWVVFQGGDWGTVDQEAWAYIVEAGHEFREGKVKLAGRIGAAVASGDDPATPEHEGFFTLLPTKHKFYGSIDYFAFSNLVDLYAELILSSGPRWNVRLAADFFQLAEIGDALYSGSGAFDEARLGYTSRRPPGGFTSRGIGSELDLELTLALRKDLKLGLGGSYFSGGDAAAETFPVKQDGSWLYTQLTWTR